MRLLVRSPDTLRLHYQGNACVDVVVLWSDDVFIDDIRLSFVLEAERRSPVVGAIALAAAVAALTSGLLLGKRWQEGPSIGESPQLPTLVVSAAGCAASDGTSAQHDASQFADLARAKREHFHFDRRDGMRALALYAQAAECYHAASAHQEALGIEAEQEQWRGELEAQMRAHTLALNIALARGDFDSALRLRGILRELVDGRRTDPFVRWLDDLQVPLLREIAKRRHVIRLGSASSE